MSQNHIAITQLAQLGFADKIAQESQGNAEAVRQAAQQAAPEALKQQKNSVPETNASEKGRKLKSEKDGRESGGSGFRNTGQRRENRPSPGGEEGANGSPWSGNILDLKV